MAMKIWHQGLVIFEDLPEYAAATKKHLASVVRPDTEIVMHGILKGTYATDYPIDELQFRPLALMHRAQPMAAAYAAEQQGYDAFVMSYLSGVMLPEIRALVDIPVANYLEAAAHLATMYGYRFGITRFAPQLGNEIKDFLDSIGLGACFAGTVASGYSYKEIFGGFATPDAVISRFKETVRDFSKNTGCDVIIPGEMPQNVFLTTNGVHRVDDIPVIDGIAATYKLAEMMVDMKRQFGLTRSRHGQKNWRPPPARVADVMRFYGMDKAWKAIGALE
ncbi:aspartate/glutamate racemase family protein [Falsiroseomonas sp.]|jgi:allantoin racemase|uniref:aspartate/glutamate racemase family protein n=1 Tax=Falsiroseomonas sp. TaxID=2870721 RepID=UPI003F7239D5